MSCPISFNSLPSLILENDDIYNILMLAINVFDHVFLVSE